MLSHARSASYHDRCFWIVGASSGIGAALAHELAARGAHLVVSARREDALNQLVATFNPEARHRALPLDVTDADAVQQAVQTVSSHWPRIDGVIFMAALYEPSTVRQMSLASMQRILDVNIKGALQLVLAVLPVLRQQAGGQLVLCGSVAGYRGLPAAQPYALTKAAIISLAETLAIEESSHGVDVRLISPGFVDTALTQKNAFSMPFLLTPEQAARSIADGLQGSSFEIHFPKRLTWMLKMLRVLPFGCYRALMRRMV